MIALALLALTATAADPMTLEDALAAAEDRPALRAARLDARAAADDATAAWLGTVGPRIGGTLTTTSRTEAIAIDTPIGAFVQQPKDVVDAGLRGEWPLLDPAGLLGRAPQATAGAHAARDQADRTVDALKVEAGEAFLQVVTAQARVDALAQLVEALDHRVDQATARVEAGLTDRSDVLRLRVAAAEARAELARAEGGRRAARTALGWTLGRTDVPEVAFAWTPPPDPGALDAALERATEDRADLRALAHQIRALSHARATPTLEALPTVSAWGQQTYTDNTALVDTQWLEGGIEVRWTRLTGGSRVARTRAARARLQAARARLDDARRGVGAELQAAAAELEAARARVDALDAAVEDADEAARQIGARHAEGLVPVVDVLEVEATRARVEADRTEARAQAVAAWLRWCLAAGVPITAPG